METSSIIIGLCILGAVIIPFYLASKRRKKSENSLVREFLATGLKYGIEISETEVWKDRILGIDTTSKKLLYRYKPNGNLTETLVDLKTTASCSPEISYLKSTGDEQVIESINLNFKMKKDHSIVSLSVYESDSDLMIYSEYEISQKWSKICTDLLN